LICNCDKLACYYNSKDDKIIVIVKGIMSQLLIFFEGK
jgi:hypothetical protein